MLNPSKSERFAALDAWRGICALLVALEHLNIDSVLHRNALIHHGFRFVDFFFVLSGFVIAHAYRERLQRGGAEVRAFLVRRIGRLWPLHIVMLLGFFGFETCVWLANHAHISTGRAAFAEHDTLASLPANILLVHSWGILDHPTWNVPSWSISTEVFAYGLFAALCALVPRKWLDPVASVLLAGSVAVILFVAPLGMRSTFDYGLFRCVFGFTMGVLIRRVWQRWPLKLGTFGEIAVVLLVVGGVILIPDESSVLVTALFALAVWVFAGEDGLLSGLLRKKLPQALGRWSYSIYMVHALVVLGMLTLAMVATQHGLHLFGRVRDVSTIIGPQSVTASITLVYLAIVVAIASFSYRHVELRGQRFFNRWVKGAEPSSLAKTF
ncbi:MAG: acyltransferase 3 [Myxococcales bacterium]|nr:acyltransferase 3 [Myxococcales bacterium]